MSFYKAVPEGIMLFVRLQPKASRDQVCGLMDNALKVRITAPPIEGRANEHARDYLADVFELPRSRVELQFGDRSRLKLFLLKGLPMNSFRRTLTEKHITHEKDEA